MLLVASDSRYRHHDPGRGHPERPARLDAVDDGLRRVGLDHAALPARVASREELERVHPGRYLDRLHRIIEDGGGMVDPDTVVCASSWDAATLAAGAGLAAVEQLDAGAGDAAFLAIRPPGHHAVPAASMGFCLINNVAVTAAALRERGERVLIVDWDAHHGNGTQDIFYADPDVFYVSLHEWPLYPGTGTVEEIGAGDGVGTTLNVPLPAGTTGDVYLEAFDEVIAPVVARFDPTWVLVSAGYDAHRADPITGLGLSSGDFADLTARVMALAPRPGRLVLFLEGGYDLEALRDSVSATASTLLGEPCRPEPPTAGGPGRPVVGALRDRWALELGR